MIDITLSPREVARCRDVAQQRWVASRTLKNAHGYRGDRGAVELVGTQGELAACKAMGIEWNEGVNTFKAPDAGTDIQIRTAPSRLSPPSPRFGTLIIRPNDNPDHRFVLVTGKAPYFRVCGWIRGQDARKDCWLRSEAGRPPAWFVPSAALNPMPIGQ